MSNIKDFMMIFKVALLTIAKKMKMTQMFLSGGVLYNGMLTLSNKRNRLLTHVTTGLNLKCIMLPRKKPDSKGYTLYDSIYMTFWIKQNYMDINQTGNFHGFAVRGEIHTRHGGMFIE